MKLRNLFVFTCFLSLAGCEHFEQDADATVQVVSEDAEQVAENIERRGVSIADHVRDSSKVMAQKLRTWWIVSPSQKKGMRPVAASYCYKTLQDILCYNQPMPGWEHRLVAYQGTGAPPPGMAQMEVLPKRVINPEVLPESRVARAKPVFTNLPPPPKEEVKDISEPAILDPTREQLPNPILSPQL